MAMAGQERLMGERRQGWRRDDRQHYGIDAWEREAEQPKINDYALIGDCHGAALVSSMGSIDWSTLLRFHDDPDFFRLLDSRGGFWDIVVEDVQRVSRGYIANTNILETCFETGSGTLVVTDFMPVGRTRTASTHDYVSLNAPGWLVRRFSCTAGSVDFTTRFRPNGANFSIEPLKLKREDGCICAPGGLSLYCRGEVTLGEQGALIRYSLREGDLESCVLTRIAPLSDPIERCEYLYRVTRAFWTEWSEYRRYRGPHDEAVNRSALTLKLLTYAPTGAMVAAPTTSLPESIGGERNWDYRFSWVRDSTFALFALSVLGYSGEGHRFSNFLRRRCLREGSTLRIMYSVDGEPFLPERAIDHLEGYRGSSPVRVGNEASEQRQLDVFGEVLDWAELRVALGSKLSKDEKALLVGIAGHVCRTWHLPDQGLWEIRADPRNFVHGKAMAWVALDRAARLLGDREPWRKTRAQILEAITQEGCRGDPPYLTQAFGSSRTDAALLQIPLLGLPLPKALVSETVHRIEAELQAGDFLYRYTTEDGLSGGEGAFLSTSFWLVEALLLIGREDDAEALFERLLGHANDVGLFAEEIDPVNGNFLGNFPQAFTHLALISSASLLQLYRTKGRRALEGTNADRAKRLAGATEGTRALLHALLRNRSVRLRSSRKSVLALT
jgi:GH15 family glucan-1,4-alpha-glucosidase